MAKSSAGAAALADEVLRAAGLRSTIISLRDVDDEIGRAMRGRVEVQQICMCTAAGLLLCIEVPELVLALYRNFSCRLNFQRRLRGPWSAIPTCHRHQRSKSASAGRWQARA